jgi:hypothetical protein
MTIGRAFMSIFRFSLTLGMCGSIYSMVGKTLNEPPFSESEIFDGVRVYFSYEPALIGGLFLFLLILWAFVSEPIMKVWNTPIANRPSTTAPAKKTESVGKCQDCGCELIDTEATFCEDCQLAVFMANDEDMSLAQVGDE